MAKKRILVSAVLKSALKIHDPGINGQRTGHQRAHRKTPTDWVPVVVLQILFVKKQHHNRSG